MPVASGTVGVEKEGKKETSDKGSECFDDKLKITRSNLANGNSNGLLSLSAQVFI
jgi:hypothetical protein